MKPIQKILAATDFSNRSTRALKYAIALAQATEAKLYILHAYRVPAVATGTPYPMAGLYTDTLTINQQVEKEVEQSFEEIKLLHLKGHPIRYEFISSCAFPEEAIEEAIPEKAIDLVVMGNRGDSSFEKLLGSTTTHMMRRTTCPILAIPENTVYAKVDHMLFATDYEQVNRADNFQALLGLARLFRAQIDVLHITSAQKKLSQEKLAIGEGLERILHTPHQYHHADSDDVLEGLQMFLKQHDDVGMVAVMPRDHSLWERLTHSSISKEIIFDADRPVLIFH